MFNRSTASTALSTVIAALILTLLAAVAVIAPGDSRAAAQSDAGLSCQSDAGALTWSGGPDDVTYWVYRSTGDAYRWLGRSTNASMLVDPAPRVGATYQVHYQGIPRVECTTTSEPSAADCQATPLEAEDALLVGRFVAGADQRASDGAYAHVPRNTGGEWNGARTNFVEFCVTVEEAGDYRIDATLLAPRPLKRSFYVTVDDGNFVEFIAPRVVNNYQTVAVNDAGLRDPLNATNQETITEVVTWNLSEGDHYIRFYLRRDGTRLDKINLVRFDGPPAPTPDPTPMTLPAEVLADREAVRAIYEANGLAIPSTVCRLTTVRCSEPYDGRVVQLDLRGLGITSLPPEIGDLTAVFRLNLSSNQLTDLPPEIGNLIRLKQLFAERNQLTELPDSITRLPRLECLCLNGNQLTSLPTNIDNLTNLKNLLVADSQLTELPASIVNLQSLIALNVHGNQLTELPDDFGNLTALRTLYLDNNQLTELPDDFGNLTDLWLVNVSVNRLTSLPPDIGNLTRTHTFIAFGNQLTDLPDTIGTMTSLTRLDIQRNQLTNLPETIGDLTNLELILADSNLITDIAVLPQSLERLSLRNNNLVGVPPAVVELPNLSGLALSNNEIRGDITALATLLERQPTISIGDGDVAQTLGPVDVGNDCMTTTSPELATYLDANDPAWSRCDNP